MSVAKICYATSLLPLTLFLHFRVLGFYRAPPVAGRVVNLEEEVEPIGEVKLMDTFFKESKKSNNPLPPSKPLVHTLNYLAD